tara:strand:- start:1826 stop:2071 length:246 start_codon:yes stop_codon:yes gene_type:complete
MDNWYSDTTQRKNECYHCGKEILKQTDVIRVSATVEKYARACHPVCAVKYLEEQLTLLKEYLKDTNVRYRVNDGEIIEVTN